MTKLTLRTPGKTYTKVSATRAKQRNLSGPTNGVPRLGTQHAMCCDGEKRHVFQSVLRCMTNQLLGGLAALHLSSKLGLEAMSRTKQAPAPCVVGAVSQPGRSIGRTREQWVSVILRKFLTFDPAVMGKPLEKSCLSVRKTRAKPPMSGDRCNLPRHAHQHAAI